jgi:2-polyprenyl-3-methyl-5-hydroxy-6-metoxy-1,4-benzoquinol methylase
MSRVATDRPVTSRCPLCGGEKLSYLFAHAGTPIVRCDRCRLVLRNPQPSDQELAAIHTSEHSVGGSEGNGGETNRLKRETAAGYLDEIEAKTGRPPRGTRLLEIGPGLGNLLVEAVSRGYDVSGVEDSERSVQSANQRIGSDRVVQGSLATVSLPAESFDIAILSGVLEHTRDPLADLLRLWPLLRPGGTLFIAVPSLDSWSARVMRERWLEFTLEHLYYFDSATLQLLLFKAGFEQVTISTGWKTLSPEYVRRHFERFDVPVLSSMTRVAAPLLPAVVRRRHVRVGGSGINVIATRSTSLPPAERPQRLSVVMPVFNERATFPVIIEQLLRKSIPGVDIAIIVVESNSTDGTRDAVAQVAGHERVTVIYEDRPRGKGHAVRTGLARATGDYVLIQDADLEYDLDDYEALLEPLMTGRAAFVIGSRHGKDGPTWKVRHFADQVAVSWFMNVGHILFTTLFNVTYGTRLRDPFTMFKVFRRDCLHGLTFEANRFDFDWELVGKLVRAGYRPLEIPVNYRSRSFSEGKKVSLFRDPLTWIRACFKYRFEPLGKKPR